VPPSRHWEALADGLLDASILARLEASWPGRSAHERSQAWIERQLRKVDDSLAAMSRGLGDNTYCSGNPPEFVRHRGGLCAGLPQLPFSTNRLGVAPPQPGAALQQTDAAPKFH